MSDTVICIDSPKEMPSDELFYIQGWIISHSEIHNIWISSWPKKLELELVERPDVVNAHASYPHVKGFVGTANRAIIERRTIKLEYRLTNGCFFHNITLYDTRGVLSRPLTEEGKRQKLARIAPYLVCPQCGSKFAQLKSKCLSCDATYSHTIGHFNFLTNELKAEFKIVDTENISSHRYDPIALSMIKDYSEGLILDCGAGRRDTDYPNVINLEVADYPSTDVLAVGEKLPFQEETFDAVLSLSVLEHVKNPFKCAQEVCRVLKKGGVLYCVVPFLQPVHAYPNHFYNMTSQGLRNLFEPNLEIVDCKVPLSGVPMWTLIWFLRSWVEGLEGKTRKDFLDMRISDLIGDSLDYLERDFVRNLSEEKNFELASSTLIIGKKSKQFRAL